MVEQRDPHTGLHSEQGALAGEHPGRVPNPVVKVHDLAWLEFEKPDLERAEVFARDVRLHDGRRAPRTSCSCGAPTPGAPCVLIRKGPRSRFVGPAFRAADPADVVRLADATGRTVAALPESLGGVGVDLVDPSGAAGAGGRRPGRAARAARPGAADAATSATRPRGPTPRSGRRGAAALVQRLGHVVLETNRYRADAGLVPATTSA